MLTMRRTAHHSAPMIAQSLTTPQMARYFGLFGLSLIAAAFIYLIGANWLALPDVLKLSIMPALMLITALISLRVHHPAVVSTLHTICGLFAGLTLAAIGQVYQTGADSAWLFIIWSGLLVPWLYRANLGVFILLGLVSQIAAWQAGTQLLGLGMGNGNELWLVILCYSVIAAITLIFRSQVANARWFIAFIFGAYAFYAGVSLGNLLAHASVSQFEIVIRTFIMLVPWMLFWVWHKNTMLAASVALVFAAVALFSFIISWMDSENILLNVLASQLWFGFLAYGLYRYYQANNQVADTHKTIKSAPAVTKIGAVVENDKALVFKSVSVMLACGGWLTSTLLSFWAFEQIIDLSLIIQAAIASAVIAVGLVLLGFMQRLAYFRHLGYALVAVGIMIMLYRIGDTPAWWQIGTVWAVVVALLMLRTHWLPVALAVLVGYGLLVVKSFGGFSGVDMDVMSSSGWLLYAIGLCAVLLLERLPSQAENAARQTDFMRLIGFVSLAIAAGFMVYFTVSSSVGDGVYHFIASVPLLIIFGALLAKLSNRAWVALLPLGALAGFGYAGILVALIVYALSVQRDDKFMQGLALVTGIGLVWLLYYQLSLPFIWKFISMGIMGLAFIGIGAALTVNRRADTDIMGVVS